MTPQEATEHLFAAAKKGDTAAAQAALDAGADDTARDNQFYTPLMWAHANDHADAVKLLAEKAAARRDKQQTKDNIKISIGWLLAGIVSGAMWYGTFFGMSDRQRSNQKRPNKPPAPETAEALHTMLKDPAFTEQLFEQLKDDPSVIQKFAEDADIMTNLQTLAEAIEGKDAPKDRNWASKAVKRSESQHLERQ